MPSRSHASTSRTRRKKASGKAPSVPAKSRESNAAKPLKVSLTPKAPASRAKAHKAAELKPSAEAPISTFNRAVGFLDTLSNFESLRIVRYTPENFNLERMRTLCRRLGNPHLKYPTVHVAGTKGKGSTCAMVAAMLRAAGYRVGLYASPHLVDLRERIRVLDPAQDAAALPQGEMISQAEFARLTRGIEPFVSSARLRPSWFDTFTAIAFAWFAQQEVDIAVIETGLGGRLDSTNVVEPLVTAVTSISMDHARQLGPTLAKIAAEKAGIFKPGAAPLTCEQDPEVEAVLRKTAQQNGAPLQVLGREIDFSTRFEASRMLGRHNRICFNTDQLSFDHLAVPLLGEHQAINCGVALGVVDQLRRRGFDRVTEETCTAGLARLQLAGRMEVLRESPIVVADAAHNAASIEALLKGLGQHFRFDASVLIFGCCNDKDVGGMLERLVVGADKIIFTRIDSIRSADPRELAQQYTERFGRMAQVAESLPEALQTARRAATGDDLVCITGSFYLVGQAKKLFARRAAAGRSGR